jgi:hypothetical protein
LCRFHPARNEPHPLGRLRAEGSHALSDRCRGSAILPIGRICPFFSLSVCEIWTSSPAISASRAARCRRAPGVERQLRRSRLIFALAQFGAAEGSHAISNRCREVSPPTYRSDLSSFGVKCLRNLDKLSRNFRIAPCSVPTRQRGAATYAINAERMCGYIWRSAIMLGNRTR